MYTGYIVKAGEICKDERVAKAIKNFKYENDTVLCVGDDGYITEINTLRTAKSIVGEQASPEAYLAAYLEKLNTPAEEAAERYLRARCRNKTVDEALLRKLSAALQRRGFSWQDIQAPLRRLESEIQE